MPERTPDRPKERVPERAPDTAKDKVPEMAPGRAEDSPNFFDESFDFEEPFDLLESSDAPAALPPVEELEEPRPRKRHRRRRSGRDSERPQSRAPSESEAAGKLADQSPAPRKESEPVSTIVAAEGIGVEELRDKETHGEAAEGEERRPRHHRGRRGRKKRPSDELTPAVAGEAIAEQPAVGPAPSRGRNKSKTAVVEAEDAEAGEDDGGDEDRPTKVGFRGIPTWDEAVGLLITKNLESRSKRPNGGPSKGRGNRSGPRDNRAGRSESKRRS
jgi:hypothetical protein